MAGFTVVVVSLSLLAGSANAGPSGPCIAPGRCTPFPAKYTKVLPLEPRQQWKGDGGFCGAQSIQSSALAFGAWISQDIIRYETPKGEGHGNATQGYEVLPSNVAAAARNLHLAAEQWDYNQPKPQVSGFKRWMKKHLSKGHPIVWFPMCKGDSHLPYPNSNPNGGHFDHVEPVWGIGSNHPLDDEQVYDDDWLLHGSNQDLQTYYRKFDTLEDTPDMNGNCKIAQAGYGKNEMYPCIYDQVDYGLAVTGLYIPDFSPHLTANDTFPTSLAVDIQAEPDIRTGQKPLQLNGTVTASGLTKGHNYIMYRITKGRQGSGHAVEYRVFFTANGTTWTRTDPHTIPSNSATYYVTVKDKGDSVVV